MLSLRICIGKIFWGIAQSMILTFWKETFDFVAELMICLCSFWALIFWHCDCASSFYLLSNTPVLCIYPF